MNGLVAYLTENCCVGGECAPACKPVHTARSVRRVATST
jgi:hypothetical protein